MTISIDPHNRDDRARRDYTPPGIVLELDLETRAGSVLPDGGDPLDLTGLGDDPLALP